MATPDAKFTVAAYDLKPLIGVDLFDQLGLPVTQFSPSKGNQIDNNTTHSPIKELVATKLTTRIGRSKIHVAKSKFHKSFQLRLQKGTRIPITSQKSKPGTYKVTR